MENKLCFLKATFHCNATKFDFNLNQTIRVAQCSRFQQPHKSIPKAHRSRLPAKASNSKRKWLSSHAINTNHPPATTTMTTASLVVHSARTKDCRVTWSFRRHVESHFQLTMFSSVNKLLPAWTFRCLDLENKPGLGVILESIEEQPQRFRFAQIRSNCDYFSFCVILIIPGSTGTVMPSQRHSNHFNLPQRKPSRRLMMTESQQ